MAITLSGVCTLAVLILVLILVIRYCNKRQASKAVGEYEKILSSSQSHSGSLPSLDKQQVVINSSLRWVKVKYKIRYGFKILKKSAWAETSAVSRFAMKLCP